MEIQTTQNLKLLSKWSSDEQLKKHWAKLYDEFWKQKNDSFSKMILRKEDEIAVKEGRLLVLHTLQNIVVSFIKYPEAKKETQKTKVLELYIKQTKNKVNTKISDIDLHKKITDSITNFTNAINKLKDEVQNKGQKEIHNSFDIIAPVLAYLKLPIDIKTITVSEFLAYEKIAKQQIKQDGRN